jgi:hypothetical protein
MFPRVIDIAVNVLRFGSVSIFLAVVSFFVFLLLISEDRRKIYLSKPAVRRFVEYVGNVSLGDEGSVAAHDLTDHHGERKIVGRA